MYKLEYLPIARQDLVDIVRYISQKLSNPQAAEKLALEILEAVNGILEFPYSTSAYTPIRPLKQEYRKLIVQNYIVFYWVTERARKVTVARILYSGRDIDKLIQ